MERPVFTIRSRHVLLETGFLAVEELAIADPEDRIAVRQVVRHPGAVAIVAIHEGDVVLIRQYRAAVDADVLELPAGKLDVPGEDRRAAAMRELEEEVGLRPGHIEELARFHTAPGFSDEDMTLFLATGCTAVPTTPHGLEEEHAEVVRIAVEDLPRTLDEGVVVDAKTLVGLLEFLRRPA